MTDSVLLNLILATPAAKTAAIAGFDNQVPALLPPQTIPQSYMLTTRGVLKALGTLPGVAAMQGLRAAAKGQTPLAPVLSELLPMLDDNSSDGGVDLSLDTGNPTLIQSLVAAQLLTTGQAATLTALATTVDVVPESQVSRVLGPFRNDGMAGADNWTGA